VSAAGPWYRTHRSDLDPLFFGRLVRNRFDAPDKSFGVLYLAREPHGAFIETFGRDRDGFGVLGWSDLQSRSLTQVESREPLVLVDLSGAGLARGDHSMSRSWSAALYRHPSSPDGIAYRCRHDPDRVAVAVFDRVAPRLSTIPLGRFSEWKLRSVLRHLLDAYELGVLGAPSQPATDVTSLA